MLFHYAECRILFTIIPNVNMLSVAFYLPLYGMSVLSVIMLSVYTLSIYTLSIVMLSVVAR
jgi:hypothetical protein